MTKILLATPDNRKTVNEDDALSPKEIMDKHGINYSRGTVMIDGMILSAGQLRQSLTELGVTGDCTLSVTVKLDNA
jgi:hypothetical protein